MKKLFAFLLALTMVLSLCTAALAAEDEAPYLLGSMDMDSYTYTNEDFGMSFTCESGWYYAGMENMASYYGWTETDDISAAEYLKQLIDEGNRTIIMAAQSEDGSHALQLDVFAHEGVGGYASGGSPLGEYMIPMALGGEEYMESMGMVNCKYAPGKVMIGDHEYEVLHFEYDLPDETTGETSHAYEVWLCLLHRDEEADCDYVMTIGMVTMEENDLDSLASMLTLPEDN